MTDARGCRALTSVIISQPATIVRATATTLNNISCNGGNNGSVTVSGSGGVGN
ncbi:MAG: hypothetical protein EBX37_18775, partial [Alphaproteobacteria bacterium]|nr:hypothetical protein [Alphaproteobacteria bacterium]